LILKGGKKHGARKEPELEGKQERLSTSQVSFVNVVNSLGKKGGYGAGIPVSLFTEYFTGQETNTIRDSPRF